MTHIIPKPLYCNTTGGTVPFGAKTVFSGDFEEIFQVLREFMPKTGGGNKIIFVKDTFLEKEEYRIECGEKDITVFAADKSGAFYAVMSLIQLNMGRKSLPQVIISDKPRFYHRGFMLDCSRHFWTVEKIKKILDFMALLKMNVFHWHLSDDQGWRIEIEKYPLLTEKGAVRRVTDLNKNCSGHYAPQTVGTEYGRGLFYTKAQARDIVDYAAERFIKVIPEIDMPGHMSAAIACYPELSCTGEKIEVPDEWGVLKNLGCPGKQALYTFARDIIDELCEIFPSEYFHIGGDEVLTEPWESCPDCQRLMKEKKLESPRDIQGYFNGVIADYLAQKGKVLVGWNEILNSNFAAPDKMVGQWWVDSGTETEREWLKNGGQIILSFLDYMYMDHPYSARTLEKTYSFEPELLGVPEGAHILGIEIPQWTEHIRTEEKLDLYTNVRLLAAAEISWTAKEEKDYKDFEERVEKLRNPLKALGIKTAPHEFYSGRAYTDNPNGHISEIWDLWHADPDFEMKCLKK